MAAINKEVQLKASAIFFSSLIGIALWALLAAIGSALGLGLSLEIHLSETLLLFLGCFIVLVLTSIFSLVGYIASRVSHQKIRFDSIIHSFSAWSCMTVILVLLLFGATAAHKAENAFNRIKSPALVTDVEVFKAKATTTIETDKEKKPTVAEKKEDKLLAKIWLISSISMLLGLGACILGGLYGRMD